MFRTEIVKFYVDFMKTNIGKGPRNIRVYVNDSTIILYIKGSLTTLEQSALNCSVKCQELIKEIRSELINKNLNYLSEKLAVLTKINDLKIKRYSLDIDYKNDQEVVVLICNQTLYSLPEVQTS